jgi:hypothetical protein
MYGGRSLRLTVQYFRSVSLQSAVHLDLCRIALQISTCVQYSIYVCTNLCEDYHKEVLVQSMADLSWCGE